ncbi:mediator of RNA polymerase II transcription subunit 14-like isoform X2 [Bolinopsis microptera]|uniref:mediator of RNA polymerase II transcription subunit 14-like isoform X2 n=1 Tax=Bolinopsis microptera TaxID=2820187 RepID=UPI00307A2724
MEEGQNVVPLTLLIDYLVQKTYHDLIVLSELLPRKSDTERKTSIYQFSNRTQLQFIRLLALVKWACKASRVDKCTEIIMFLDKQAALFVETADSLFTISKERLMGASFPVFGLQSAVDVLVTGTYSRLPLCIKDKIIPSLTLSDKEKTETLNKLTSLIEQRLVLSKIPIKYKNIEIEQGYVKLTVPHEFTVRLTVPNDDFKNPWRLLSFDVLVQNPKDDDPRPVVHLQQKEYLTELLQSRLFDPDQEPLENLCVVAHQFCLSLQLEILYQQAMKMKNVSWNTSRIKMLQVVDYIEGDRLTVRYWSGVMAVGAAQPGIMSYAILVIYLPGGDPLDSFKIDHRPDISKIPDRDTVKLDISNLSLERLLEETIEHRTYEFLSKLKDRLSLVPDIEIVSLNCEELVTRYHKKIELKFLLVHYTGYAITFCNYNVLVSELTKAINDTMLSISDALNKIRMRVDLLLIKNSLQIHQIRHQLVPFTSPKQVETVPLLNSVTAALYIRFKSNIEYCLAIDLQHSKLRYLLLKLEPQVNTPDLKHCVLNRVIACTEVKDISVFSIIDLDSMSPLDVILKMERAILYINLKKEWKKKGQKCLGIVPQGGNWCLKLLTLPTNHPVLKQLLRDLTVYVHCVSPAVIKYSLVFDTKHKILPPNTCGVVQTFYSNSLKLVVENFSLKWKEIHFLFTLLYNFQCLNNTSLGYIKQYNFHYMILGYSVEGVEYECYINLRQTKYRLVFYQSRSGRPNPHALIKEHLEHELGTHQSIFKLLHTLQRTAHLCSVVYSLPKLKVSYWGLDKASSNCRSPWSYFTHSANTFRIQYRNSPNSMAVDITCYTADSYCIRDAAAAGATRVAKYSPIHLLGKILELIAKRIDGATVEVLAVPAYSTDTNSRYVAASPQPATPGYNSGSTQPTTPGFPGTPGYSQQPNTPSYHNPSPANKPQPSPQNPFVQPQPSPMGAPSPAIMSLMSPQTPQYMPPSPAAVPSPSMQPSPGSAQHLLGSPNYRAANTSQPAGQFSQSPNNSNKSRTPRHSTTLFINKPMLNTLLNNYNNPFTCDNINTNKRRCCVLENLISACLLKRHIASAIPDKIRNLLSIRSNELMSTSLLHSDLCFYRFSIEPNNFQSLQLSVTPTKDGFWNKKMIDTLVAYFAEKIAVNPFKYNALISFLRILGAPKDILQQFINIMTLELEPNPRFQWNLKWFPLVPPVVQSTNNVLQPGMCGALFSNHKILFFIQLEHPQRPNNPVTIPMVFESQTGTTKRAGAELMPNDYMAQRFRITSDMLLLRYLNKEDSLVRVLSVTTSWNCSSS